jgi:hypothetical protein
MTGVKIYLVRTGDNDERRVHYGIVGAHPENLEGKLKRIFGGELVHWQEISKEDAKVLERLGIGDRYA